MTIKINREIFYTTTEFASIMRYADERPVRSAITAGKIPHIQRADGRYLIPAWYVNRQLSKAGGSHGQQ